jgi:hypothetical protein
MGVELSANPGAIGTSWGMHLGILWELDGNMSGTNWEPGGKKKFLSQLPLS